ncbi:unnamed protein product [Bemisia tabaci]|uniref:Tetratricopeptide repeat protein 8 n=1 Tax=Bemisia tabaci TaxID=7038 RepID=A0A9P0F3D4_BEMTA|nr:unnamed protein product [Bemisia tabaci]
MDVFYSALSEFRRRKFEDCINHCTQILEKSPYDQAAWTLKMKALTAQVMVDDIEVEEEGIADSVLNETMATTARPGTSFKNPTVLQSLALGAQRPKTNTGRPVSGVVRPGTIGSRGTLEQALRTPRSASSARPATAQSGRAIRLGTASMLTQSEGPFIQLSRLNLAKYASTKAVSKPLFQYIFYHENDILRAMDLVVEAMKVCDQKDWWWRLQHGKCYYIFGMMRDAETELRAALKLLPTLEVFLWLTRIYIRLDQPVTALDLCRTALQIFKDEVTLLTDIARIFEGINNIPLSVKYYREILHQDAMNVEAVACIAVHYFYSDQPELALRFYRRLLQMGVYNAELFNNLGLCCFYAQQYDMVVSCFERALSLAENENAADVWYNISHIAILENGSPRHNQARSILELASK